MAIEARAVPYPPPPYLDPKIFNRGRLAGGYFDPGPSIRDHVSRKQVNPFEQGAPIQGNEGIEPASILPERMGSLRHRSGNDATEADGGGRASGEICVPSGGDAEGVGVGVGLVRGEGDREIFGGLGEAEGGGLSQEIDALDGFGEVPGVAGEGADGEGSGVRPAEGEGVEEVAFGGEADVRGGVGALLVFGKAPVVGEVLCALAEDAEGACAVDGFPVGGDPGGEGFEKGELILVDGAVAADGDGEEQVTVFADHVDEGVDDGARGLVGVAVEDGAFVVPVADAGVGLPGVRQDVFGATAFDVEGDGAGVIGFEIFAVDDALERTVAGDGAVVEVGGGVETGLAEGEVVVVEVDEVGLVFVHELLAAEEPGVDKAGVVGWGLLGPDTVVVLVPIIGGGDGGEARGHDEVAAGVELLGVEAVPPLAFAVGSGEVEGVVAHALLGAGGIVAVGGLEPVPGVGGVVGDAEAEAVGAGDGRPGADDVLLGADAGGVPGVVGGGEVIEVVVVVGERDEVLGARGLVEAHELFGLPLVGLPEVVDLHEAGGGGVAVGLEVVLVLGVALEVHLAGVPVALLGDALRGPVGPDAELGVTEPVGRFIGAERGPGGLEGAGGDVAGRGGGLREEARREGCGGGGGEGVAKEAAGEVGRAHRW